MSDAKQNSTRMMYFAFFSDLKPEFSGKTCIRCLSRSDRCSRQVSAVNTTGTEARRERERRRREAVIESDSQLLS